MAIDELTFYLSRASSPSTQIHVARKDVASRRVEEIGDAPEPKAPRDNKTRTNLPVLEGAQCVAVQVSVLGGLGRNNLG